MLPMDRRTFTKMLGLMSLPSKRVFGEIKNNQNIVVIGAGIVGVTIAFELVKKGANVTLIEKNSPASGASGHSFSWINATYPKRPYDYNLLSQLGISAYKSLETEIDLKIRWNGSLEWFREEKLQNILRTEIDNLKRYPTFTPINLITSDEAESLEPNVDFNHSSTISYSESDGAIDTERAIQLILQSYKSYGGKIIYPCQFKSFNKKNNKLISIDTTAGNIQADYAIFACGINTDKELRINSSSIPTSGIIIKTKPMKNLFNRIIVGPGVHIHQQLDGSVVIGEQDGAPLNHFERLREKPNRFPSKEFEEMHIERIMNHAKIFTNGLEDIDIDHVSIGWRPLPKDGVPVIGRINSIQGVYVAMMHSGVSLAAVVSKLVSEEILEDKNNSLLDHFRPSRFA